MPRPRTVGAFSDAARATLAKQARDYPRYVKACREGQTGGVRIRAQEGACFYCLEAAARTYDGETLPQLPLRNCAGDSQGYCSCSYVALRQPATPEPASRPPPETATTSTDRRPGAGSRSRRSSTSPAASGSSLLGKLLNPLRRLKGRPKRL